MWRDLPFDKSAHNTEHPTPNAKSKPQGAKDSGEKKDILNIEHRTLNFEHRMKTNT
jgi:hypothetical protein